MFHIIISSSLCLFLKPIWYQWDGSLMEVEPKPKPDFSQGFQTPDAQKRVQHPGAQKKQQKLSEQSGTSADT
jgi:hypothetical protein